jgi:hypothetical protein
VADPNEDRNDLIEPPPIMLSPDSGQVTTPNVDPNEFSGTSSGFPVPAPPPHPPFESEPNPTFFQAFCNSMHPPGTLGCPPEGGLWTGEFTTDIELARGQMRFHNETFDLDPSHVPAFVAVRIAGVFVPQPDIF